MRWQELPDGSLEIHVPASEVRGFGSWVNDENSGDCASVDDSMDDLIAYLDAREHHLHFIR